MRRKELKKKRSPDGSQLSRREIVLADQHSVGARSRLNREDTNAGKSINTPRPLVAALLHIVYNLFPITYYLESDPDGIRTRVAALKGPCPRPLDDGAAINSNIRLA